MGFFLLVKSLGKISQMDLSTNKINNQHHGNCLVFIEAHQKTDSFTGLTFSDACLLWNRNLTRALSVKKVFKDRVSRISDIDNALS